MAILRVAAFSLLVLVLSACATAPAASPAQKIKMKLGYSAASGAYLAFWAAQAAGLYDKHGLDTELVLIQSGPTAVQTIISQEVHIGHGGSDAPIRSIMQGSDIVVFGANINKGYAAIVVNPSITKPEDLKGKKLGVTRFGSLPDNAARFALRKWGLRPDVDVTMVDLAAGPNILSALLAGQIDAGSLTDPNTAAAKKAGLKVLAKLSDLNQVGVSVGLYTARDYLAKNRDAVKRFLKAHIEATRYFKNNKDASVAILQNYLDIKDASLLESVWSDFAKDYTDDVPIPKRESVEALIKDIVEADPKVKPVTYEQVVDLSLLDELEKEGFIKQVYGR